MILNWLDPQRTLRAVSSVRSAGLVNQIIVVDNQSTGEMRAAIEAAGIADVILIESMANNGFSRGVNLGLRRSLELLRSEFVLVLNNDATVFAETIEALIAKAKESERTVAVAPRVLGPDGVSLSLGGRFRTADMLSRDDDATGSPEFLTWACVLLSKSGLREVGLLDERFFMYWEDVEFGLRARRAGFQIRWIGSHSVVHEISSSHSKAGVKIQLYSSMGVIVLACILGPRAWTGALYRSTGRVVASIATGRFSRGWAHLRGIRLGFLAYFRGSAFDVLESRQII